MKAMMLVAPTSHWLLLTFQALADFLRWPLLAATSEVTGIPIKPAYRLYILAKFMWCTGVLVGAFVPSCSLTGDPTAAAFAASSFKAWFRVSVTNVSQPMRRCCFTSQSLTELIKAWAVSL
jgi:hypothetical protein